MKQKRTQFVLYVICCALHFVNSGIMTYIAVSYEKNIYLFPAVLFLLCFVINIVNAVKARLKTPENHREQSESNFEGE